MSSASLQKLQGFVVTGTAAPFFDPNGLVIVGLDVPETAENWYAHDSRLQDESDAALSGYIADMQRAVEAGAGYADNVLQGCRDGDRIIILDGRRTTRAARIVRSAQAQSRVPHDERLKVRVVIHAGTPDDWFRINVGSHKQKPLTPLQVARGYLNLFRRFAEDHQRVADLYGVTVQTVKNQLSVSQASAKVQKLYDAGKFPLRELVKLAGTPREKQDEVVDKLEAAGALQGAAAANGIVAAKRAIASGDEVEVKRDLRKVRPKAFLMKLEKSLKKARVTLDGVGAADLIRFVLGGPVPRGATDDFKAALEKAGFVK